MNRGFTLVEILVAIAIVAIIGTIMVAIFSNTLRGSNKAQILASLKQNGQAVLENMDKTVRNADDLICPTSGSSNTIVVSRNGTYTRYRIALSTDAPGSAPASCIGSRKNGCIVSDNPIPQGSELLQSFIGRICNPLDSMSLAQVLTDTNTQTGIQIMSGSFATTKPAGFKAALTVNFILRPGAEVPESVTGQIDPVTFQTTVQLR